MFCNMLQFAWPPFCTAHSLSRKTQAHLPFTVCVWPQRYKHREWSDTVHMQLHYEYFKSDSIRVTLMSKCKIKFILHFVSLHSKVSELEILESCCSVFFWNLECSSVFQVAATEFQQLFSFKGKSSQSSDQDTAPIFLLWVKIWQSDSVSMSDCIQWQWYIVHVMDFSSLKLKLLDLFLKYKILSLDSAAFLGIAIELIFTSLYWLTIHAFL